jgi:hypothetical protein
MESNRQILILGEPDSGKTHFGGQLIHRLKEGGFAFEMVSPPDDYDVFKPVLESLADGKSVGHTTSSFQKVQKIKVASKNGFETTLVFPDYAGEQLLDLVNLRKLNPAWIAQIEASRDWVLVLSLKDKRPEEDITNHPQHDQDAMGKENGNTLLPSLEGQGFYVELFQMLLFTKGVDLTLPVLNPRLTILLSLWDELDQPKDTQPRELLRIRMPFLVDFLECNWAPDSLVILGLSSTEKRLNLLKEDPDYQERGCTAFGYLILENGQKEPDLTQSLNYALGSISRD